MKKLITILLIFFPVFSQARADLQDSDYIDLALKISSDHILPAYKNLEIDATIFVAASVKNCQPNAVNLVELQTSYHQLMDSWQAVQHIRFGPVLENNRYHRIQFWPDKKNLTSKHVSKFVKEAKTERLQPAEFAKTSIAIQGTGALERLLFTDKYVVMIETANPERDFLCDYLSAIGQNIAIIAKNTQTEWTTPGTGYLQQIKTAGLGSDTYLSAQELIVEFYGPITTDLTSIWDAKLNRPLGSFENPKPKRAESWRSGRSLRNIRHNLLALFHLYDTGFVPLLEGQAMKSLSDQIEYEFLGALGQHSVIEKSLTELVVDEDDRQQLIELWASVFSLQETINVDLADALEIPQGFNALDGD